MVRMEHLSVCGSDLRSYDRVLSEADYPLPIGRPCHECLGIVACPSEILHAADEVCP